MSHCARSYFVVELDSSDQKKINITLGTDSHEFTLRLSKLAIYDQKTREMISAWALGLYTCPQANISHRTVEEMLDHLEREFPLERTLFPKPKLRLW